MEIYTSKKHTGKRISDLEGLARLLNLSSIELKNILESPMGKYYKTFEIPKKNKKTRTIYAPNAFLMNLQRKLALYLENFYIPTDGICGFVRNKSILHGAHLHIKKRAVLNIDFKNFFSEIKNTQIYASLKACYFTNEVAHAITHIVSYDGFLPQGAPTSPIISNFVCRRLDKELEQLAITFDCVYSRYADDLTFSTKEETFHPEIVKKIASRLVLGNLLQEIISENSFLINENKIKLYVTKERMEVTGLTVNKFVNLPREYFRELRALLYNCEVNGFYQEALKYRRIHREITNISDKYINDTYQNRLKVSYWFYRKLCGKVEYIRAIRGEENSYYLKFRKYLHLLATKEFSEIENKKRKKAKRISFEP